MTSGTGACTVKANQAGNADYNPADEVSQAVDAVKANQAITFTAPTGVTFGDADVTLNGTASSGLAVSYSSSTTANCTIVSGKLHVVGAGTCTVTASQAGNDNYLAAADVTLTFTIAQKAQTVSFTAPSSVTYGDPDVTLTATASSGLAVSYSSSTLSNCTIVSGKLHVVEAATCTVTASQGGNDNYLAAADVTRSFTIAKKGLTVTADYVPSTTAVEHFSKIYGAANPPFTVRYAGFVAGDTAASLGGTLVYTTAATAASNVGAYPATPGGLVSSNYMITFNPGTLDIFYGWDGFLQPINDTAHQTGVNESKFKLGQTIPAKFVIKNSAGAAVQQATNPTFSRTGNLGPCDSTAVPDTTEVVAPDPGVVYVWDGNQYHYNWSTKGLPGTGEYRIYANLADGTKQFVDICLN